MRALWFGESNFASRERGIYDGWVIPKHALWSRTNCSVVTDSFSQFKIVASSILPPLGEVQAEMPNKPANKNIFNILMFPIII